MLGEKEKTSSCSPQERNAVKGGRKKQKRDHNDTKAIKNFRNLSKSNDSKNGFGRKELSTSCPEREPTGGIFPGKNEKPQVPGPRPPLGGKKKRTACQRNEQPIVRR